MSEGARPVNPKIAQILSEFLAEQEQRLSGKSFSRYRQVVELLKTSLNNYAYQGLCGVDARRFEQLYNAEGEEQRQFCEIFGAEQIIPNLRAGQKVEEVEKSGGLTPEAAQQIRNALLDIHV
jgi:hypothetical protein